MVNARSNRKKGQAHHVDRQGETPSVGGEINSLNGSSVAYFLRRAGCRDFDIVGSFELADFTLYSGLGVCTQGLCVGAFEFGESSLTVLSARRVAKVLEGLRPTLSARSSCSRPSLT